ncbi:MAG: hypothetical protein Q9208_007093, partial [Pyrenodesmia sp. 3 TL-2023]
PRPTAAAKMGLHIYREHHISNAPCQRLETSHGLLKGLVDLLLKEESHAKSSKPQLCQRKSVPEDGIKSRNLCTDERKFIHAPIIDMDVDAPDAAQRPGDGQVDWGTRRTIAGGLGDGPFALDDEGVYLAPDLERKEQEREMRISPCSLP